MKQLPIIMPQLGESIAEATIVNFLIKPGDVVEADQDVIEVETNKATMNVSSPCGGKVVSLTAKLSESYPGRRDAGLHRSFRRGSPAPGPGSARRRNPPQSAANGSGADRKPAEPEARRVVEPTVRGLPVPAHAAGASYMSPRMKARMAELGLHAADLAGVAGSGAAGRVTIQDFEKFLANLEKHKLSHRLQHARGRGRRDAAKLDASAGHGGAALFV